MAITGVAFASFMFLALFCNAASKKFYSSVDDDIVELYVNGIQIPVTPLTWYTIQTFDFPDIISSIAIKAIDNMQVVAGILASTDDGSIVTNSQWKCTTQEFDGWESPFFNDSTWPAAVVSADHSASEIHGLRLPIDLSAKWIWTQRWSGGVGDIDTPVYCRIGLGLPIETGYTCGQCSNPCTPANAAAGKFYFKHITKDHFVQCSQWGQCYVMPCAPGTVWNQAITTCDWP